MKSITLTIAVVVLMALVVGGAYAMPFWQNEAAQDALESGDYDDFVSAVEDSRGEFFAEHFSEERFEQMRERQQYRVEAHEALESGDYDAWLAAHEGVMPRMDVTEDNFALFAEMRDARQSGDFERAQEIAAEIGISQGNGQGRGMHGAGMKRGGIGGQGSFGGCRLK